MSDIIDRIDELVDQQLQQERSGYDHNVNQEKCPHCGRDWHGLKITERIAQMYARRTYDETYSLAEDDSPVLCEGSDFIGPMSCGSTSGLYSTRGGNLHIESVTIGNGGARGPAWLESTILAAEEWAAEAMRAAGMPGFTLRTVTSHEEAPNPARVQFWDSNFGHCLFEVPITDWQWSADRTRATFTMGECPAASVPPMEFLELIVTTDESERTPWRIAEITEFSRGPRRVVLMNVRAELARIEQMLQQQPSGFHELGVMGE